MEKYKNIATVPYAFSPRANWSPDDIPYGLIEPSRVADDTYLFYMVAAASLVEINSDLYTRNLLEYFHDDAEIINWLVQHWQHEEIRHGIALKRYVNTVWPAFDWDRAWRRFGTDYMRLCRPDRLGPTQALELAARCVVETGTASLYTMLSRLSPEPVLAGLFSLIRGDEVRHYRYFYHYFLKYQQREPAGHHAVARTLWRRVKEVDDEDAYLAFKHVYLERHPARRLHEDAYRKFRRHYLALARLYYPYGMAVRMFVKPLGLNRRFQRFALPLLTAGVKRIH
ncbi:MAG TPA: ferritin-like domain-containing protein [Candidatus Methylomirabilis sp.]|nr:ferritin-like domain-containing protein [Candidatus Methylomirabilis sp.]